VLQHELLQVKDAVLAVELEGQIAAQVIEIRVLFDAVIDDPVLDEPPRFTGPQPVQDQAMIFPKGA